MSLDDRLRNALREGASSVHADPLSTTETLESYAKRRARRRRFDLAASGVVVVVAILASLSIVDRTPASFMSEEPTPGLPIAAPEKVTDREFKMTTGGATIRYLLNEDEHQGQRFRFYTTEGGPTGIGPKHPCISGWDANGDLGGGPCDTQLGMFAGEPFRLGGGSATLKLDAWGSWVPLNVASAEVHFSSGKVRTFRTMGAPGFVVRGFGFVSPEDDDPEDMRLFLRDGTLFWERSFPRRCQDPMKFALSFRPQGTGVQITLRPTVLPKEPCWVYHTPRLKVEGSPGSFPVDLGVPGVLHGSAEQRPSVSWLWRNVCGSSPEVRAFIGHATYGSAEQIVARGKPTTFPACERSESPSTLTWLTL